MARPRQRKVTMSNETVAAALKTVREKREKKLKLVETNQAQTARLFTWNGRDKWGYRGDFIRGKPVTVGGLPHLYENTCPAYIMSRAELRARGFKPGPETRPIAHTYNAQASRYELYDVRDCVPIGGIAAQARRKAALDWTRVEPLAHHPRRQGISVFAQVLVAAAEKDKTQ